MNRPAAPALRPSGRRRGVAVVAVALLAACTGSVLDAAAQAAAPKVPKSQRLVVLLGGHVARANPSPRSRRIETVAARRPLTRVRTVLPVLGHATTRGKAWALVRLPGRPNGHKGWIRTSRTRRLDTEWRVSINLSARWVSVYQHGRVERRFRAVVGHPSTPTPPGRYFVEEAVALSPKDEGGPFALATSARSEVLQEFNGGPGQIALHGTNNLPGPLGTAASHGCIRLSPRAITWIARRVGRGVPLTVWR